MPIALGFREQCRPDPAASGSQRRSLFPTLLRALAIFVYCHGAILAPTFHQAFHHPDHVHRGESIVELPHHDDDHPEVEPHDDHDSPHEEHGARSLWHFGVALGDDSQRTPVLHADRTMVWLGDAPRVERPRIARVRTPRLRGPPPVSPSEA